MNDLISFNTHTNKVKFLQTSGKIPDVRANHASSLVENNLYIFGGWNGLKRLNDLHYINLEKLNWVKVQVRGSKPLPRAGMPMLNYRGNLMLFGGSVLNSSYLNDLYFHDISKEILLK